MLCHQLQPKILLFLIKYSGNIVEMQVEYHSNMIPEVVLGFLKRAGNLKKLTFHADQIYRNNYGSDFVRTTS